MSNKSDIESYVASVVPFGEPGFYSEAAMKSIEDQVLQTSHGISDMVEVDQTLVHQDAKLMLVYLGLVDLEVSEEACQNGITDAEFLMALNGVFVQEKFQVVVLSDTEVDYFVLDFELSSLLVSLELLIMTNKDLEGSDQRYCFTKDDVLGMSKTVRELAAC